HVRIERALVDNWAGDIGRGESEMKIAHFVTDFWPDCESNEIVFVDRWPHHERVAENLVLKATEHGGRGLLVEIELWHRLIPNEFDFGLLIVGRDDSRIGEELCVRILIQSRQRRTKLRH